MVSASDHPHAFLDLHPIERVSGTVILPGSKSISNRTLLLAAVANGTTLVRGLLASDDTARMLQALAGASPVKITIGAGEAKRQDLRIGR